MNRWNQDHIVVELLYVVFAHVFIHVYGAVHCEQNKIFMVHVPVILFYVFAVRVVK